jgi:predicted porin
MAQFTSAQRLPGRQQGNGRCIDVGARRERAQHGQHRVFTAGADKYKVATVGASYDLGVAKLQGYYSQNKYAAQKVATYSLGASMPVGTVGVLKAAYTSVNAKGTGIDANDAHQFALGYVYNLTKRTALYTTVAKINNKGNAAYVVDGNPALANPSKGADSTGYEFGMRHAF